MGGWVTRPVDSGMPFQLDFERLDSFLVGLSVLSAVDMCPHGLAINVPDPQKAVEAASTGRSPGFDGISQKLYKAFIDLLGPAADGLNAMLEEGQLPPPSARKWPGSYTSQGHPPPTSQLRPTTPLKTHCKLFIEVFINILLGVLPSVLQKAQLCSVKGRNIMQGPILFGQQQKSFG